MKPNRTLGALLATLAIACGSDDSATFFSAPHDSGDEDTSWPDSAMADSDTNDADAGTPMDAGEAAATDAESDAAVEPDVTMDALGDVVADVENDNDIDVLADVETDATIDGPTDASSDSSPDASPDASSDASSDASPDAVTDTGVVVGDCISGATGTHAVRFRWAGSGSGSTAYVVYEANELPDTSRWRVRALSSNIGYTPVFADVYLGEGGLDLGGTVFIDVEISTLGLSSVKKATIAVYGRSFNTTSSGSFTWQTFSGTGATPSGYVANSAPYQWYPADATAALPGGDGSTLLRLRAGPPSNRLVVNRVEICFDAE